ncbi:hypothetical protein Cgig2_003241 [Carnegiea gigantea]|uniref:Uncharacterized protein n=1 Tax=Carnegiea gigantea TaxID=171969 RepID=A0A9Q1Q6Y1_9CARY|nr:hypothetical protein Cgig2_003241 [Carnegiea gigantea]
MNLLEAKPPDPFLRSFPLFCVGLFSSQHPAVFPSDECSTPAALLSYSGLLFDRPKSKICLGRSEILGFEHSIQTILDPLHDVLRSAYRNKISAFQNTCWCFCPAVQQFKKQKSTLPNYFRVEASTLMSEKEGIMTSDSLKAFLSDKDWFCIVAFLFLDVVCLCSAICVDPVDPCWMLATPSLVGGSTGHGWAPLGVPFPLSATHPPFCFGFMAVSPRLTSMMPGWGLFGDLTVPQLGHFEDKSRMIAT